MCVHCVYAAQNGCNKYVRPPNTPMEMDAGRVACCRLASDVEYAPCAILTLEKRQDTRKTDGRADGRQTDALRLPLDAASVMIFAVIQGCGLGLDVSVSRWSRDASVSSRQKITTSRSRLSYLRLVPKTLFCPNFASHINKISQITSRYYGSVNSTNRNRSVYY